MRSSGRYFRANAAAPGRRLTPGRLLTPRLARGQVVHTLDRPRRDVTGCCLTWHLGHSRDPPHGLGDRYEHLDPVHAHDKRDRRGGDHRVASAPRHNLAEDQHQCWCQHSQPPPVSVVPLHRRAREAPIGGRTRSPNSPERRSSRAATLLASARAPSRRSRPRGAGRWTRKRSRVLS